MMDETKITKEDLIKELNKDLELEYAAAIQYINHANLVVGAKYMSIAQELSVHADEEMAHAKEIAKHIARLGGNPAIDVEKINISSDTVEMLKQDFDGEKIAITRYTVRIEQARVLKEFTLVKSLMDILADEVEHAGDLEMALAE